MSLLVEAMLRLLPPDTQVLRSGDAGRFVLDTAIGSVTVDTTAIEDVEVLLMLGSELNHLPHWRASLSKYGAFKDPDLYISKALLRCNVLDETACLAFSTPVTEDPLVKEFLLLDMGSIYTQGDFTSYRIATAIVDPELAAKLKEQIDIICNEEDPVCAPT